MEEVRGKSRQAEGGKRLKWKTIKNNKNKCNQIKHKKNDRIDVRSNFKLLQWTEIKFKKSISKRTKIGNSVHSSSNKIMHADKINYSRYPTILYLLSQA